MNDYHTLLNNSECEKQRERIQSLKKQLQNLTGSDNYSSKNTTPPSHSLPVLSSNNEKPKPGNYGNFRKPMQGSTQDEETEAEHVWMKDHAGRRMKIKKHKENNSGRDEAGSERENDNENDITLKNYYEANAKADGLSHSSHRKKFEESNWKCWEGAPSHSDCSEALPQFKRNKNPHSNSVLSLPRAMETNTDTRHSHKHIPSLTQNKPPILTNSNRLNSHTLNQPSINRSAASLNPASSALHSHNYFNLQSQNPPNRYEESFKASRETDSSQSLSRPLSAASQSHVFSANKENFCVLKSNEASQNVNVSNILNSATREIMIQKLEEENKGFRSSINSNPNINTLTNNELLDLYNKSIHFQNTFKNWKEKTLLNTFDIDKLIQEKSIQIQQAMSNFISNCLFFTHLF